MIRKIFIVMVLLAAQAASAQVNPRVGIPPELAAEIERDKQSIKNHGYIDKSDRISGAEYTLNRVKERRSALKNGEIQGSKVGVYVLEDYDSTQLPFSIADLPAELLAINSENFIIPRSDRITRVYTHSNFGILKIDVVLADSSFVYDPNIQIAGNDALFFHTKNKGEKWTSTISASDGLREFLFTATKRLSGVQKERFVDMAETMVLNN